MDVWFYSILLNLALAVFKPIQRDNTSVRCSVWARLLTVNVIGFVGYGIVESYVKFGPSDFELNPVPLIGIVGPFYVSYCSFMFGYRYVGDRFSWFNGLVVRSVHAPSLQKIVFFEKSGRVSRIAFTGDRVKKSLRNDAHIDDLVIDFSRKNGIRIERIQR